jgi:hypothetical protein
MFRSTARDLRTWWTGFSDDILGADLAVSFPATDLDYHRNHPHRQPLQRSRARRDGAVDARSALCMTPLPRSEMPRSPTPVGH